MVWRKLYLMVILLSVINLINAQSFRKGYTIKGNILGLKDGTGLYLMHNTGDGIDTLEYVKSKNSNFTFKGSVLREGPAYFIKIDTFSKKYEGIKSVYIRLFIENTDILLTGSLNDLSLYGIVISGCKSYSEYVDYKKISELNVAQANRSLRQLNQCGNKDSIAIYQNIFDKDFNYYINSKKLWIDKHPNSLFTPWAILTTIDDNIELQQAYEKLSDKSKQSYFGNQLRQVIETRIQTSVGAISPDFSLPDSSGKVISLSETVKQYKLTLLDFWASWCKPCRASFPELKKIYEKYRAKGLNILTYSIDKRYEDWKKALDLDQLPWTNVWQRPNENIAKNKFLVEMVPTNYLLDAQGKIVGKELFGEQLEKKILEILNNK